MKTVVFPLNGKDKKKIYFFSVNTKNISSRTCKITDISAHSMKYIWYSPQKSKYPLYLFLVKMMDDCRDEYIHLK